MELNGRKKEEKQFIGDNALSVGPSAISQLDKIHFSLFSFFFVFLREEIKQLNGVFT